MNYNDIRFIQKSHEIHVYSHARHRGVEKGKSKQKNYECER